MKNNRLSVSLLALLSLGLVACGGETATTGGNETGGTKEPTTVEEKAELGKTLSEEELIAKAKAEKGTFLAYGNTSRITTAMKNFVEKYGEQVGLTSDTAVASKQSDSNIYSLLSQEYVAKDNSKGASFVLVQDSATLEAYRTNTTMLTNYYSNQFASNLDEDELLPLTHQYINKLFIWNNQGSNVPSFTNVWELTESKFKNNIYFKSPNSEQVNLNFLITLTSPAWVTKMEAAYKAYFNKDFEATTEYKNASYFWIHEFLNNADTASYTSDTKMAAGVSTAEGKAGLFVLSKLRDESVTSENLTVGAWQENSITPFAGFMYSMYAQLASKGPRPYTAMLFTNYLMTSEGFAPWSDSIGGYSSSKNIPVHEGDKELSFYKQTLVVEDGAYINTVKADMTDWINKILQAKA